MESKQPNQSSTVSLREITAETVHEICDLAVTEAQRNFVADNARSIAQKHFAPHGWMRAIYADETPVGFVMLSEKPEVPEYYLWRFMIDARYQGLGFGRRALELLIDRVKTLPGATELLTSVVPKPGGPEPFYRKLGFVLTGEMEHGEAVMKLTL